MSENSGIYYTLGGLGALVFIAVGLSAMIDHRNIKNGTEKVTDRDIREDSISLSQLRIRQRQLQTAVDNDVTPLLGQAEAFDALQSKLAEQRVKLDGLKADLTAKGEALKVTDEAFSGYRSTYRLQTWTAAAGEKLPSLQLRTGRRYDAVTILRVTPVGLEITHAEGNARVSAADLDPKWQERFQWRDDERRSVIARELQQRDAADAVPVAQAPAQTQVPPAQIVDTAPGPIQISDAERSKLQIELQAWEAKASALRAQCREAASHTYDSAKSAPGSLETWAARSMRLNSDFARARSYRDRLRVRLGIPLTSDSEE